MGSQVGSQVGSQAEASLVDDERVTHEEMGHVTREREVDARIGKHAH